MYNMDKSRESENGQHDGWQRKLNGASIRNGIRWKIELGMNGRDKL